MYTFYFTQIPLRLSLLLALVVFSTATTAAQDQPVQPLLLASQFSIHRLGPDQQQASAEFVVDESNDLVFHLHTSDGGLITSITAPNGEVVDPTTIASHHGEFVRYAGDDAENDAGDAETTFSFAAPGYHQLYTFPSLGPGVYSVHFAASNPADDAIVLARVIADSPLAAALIASENTLALGDVVVLTAAIFEGVNAVAGAAVSVAIYPPGEAETAVELVLRDDGVNADNAAGDGLYSGEFQPAAAGLYSVAAEMAGQTSGGLAFRRHATALFEVVAASTASEPTVAGRVEDNNGNGLFERLVIDVGLDVQQAGAYGVFVQLEASNGERLAASGRANLGTGAQTIPVVFSAAKLRGLGVDGPFTIAVVEWMRYDSQRAEPAGKRIDLGVTQAYGLNQWERPPIRLTGDNADQATDTNSNSLFDQLTVQLGVDVIAGGEYRWTARLEDSSGRAITLAAGSANLTAGVNTIDLIFDGQPIGRHGRDGPYAVTGLALYSDGDAFLGDEVAVTQAYAYTQFEGAAAAATVPNLIGLEQAAAESALAAAGLTIGISDTLYSTAVAAGRVLSQTPGAGAVVAEGYAVDVNFSLGPRSIQAPDVRGLSQANARIVLEILGLAAGAMTEQSSAEPEGQVLFQNPSPGAALLEASSVDLTVSRGDLVKTPDLQGMSQADAEALVNSYPLTLGPLATAFHDTVPAGLVASQQPAAGAAVQPGTEVRLTISLGRGIVVPDVVRLSEAEAKTTITNSDLRVGNISQTPNTSIPQGAVAGQNPPAGATVAISSPVDLLISAGPVEFSTTPQLNSTAPANTRISFAYPQAVASGSVGAGAFAVHASQTGLVAGALAVEGQNVRLTPNRPFKPGELVYVTATRDVQFQDGGRPDWPVVWQFQIKPPTASAAVFTHSGDDFLSVRNTALGDLDGDDDLDVFRLRDSGSNILFNTGNGVLVEGDQILRLNEEAVHGRFVALGDLDGDSDLDAFIAILNKPGFPTGEAEQVWFNDGAGRFTDSGQRLRHGDSLSERVALGDLDGDGDLDALVSDHGLAHNWAASIWHNEGTGFFTQTQVINPPVNQTWILGDVDGDGDLDAFASSLNGPNQVWLNNGLGTFIDSGQRLGGANVSIMAALNDVDGDGDLDAVVANSDSASEVWLNQGGSQGGERGVFANSGQALEGNHPDADLANHTDADLVDVDGDGDLDAILEPFSGPSEIWRNDGAGIFTRRGSLGYGDRITDTSFGDLDGDGTVDAFVTHIDTHDRGAVLLNKIPFAPQQSYLYLPYIRR
jgi:beta-lactam-binding protein with PASTA domain